jgi:hypothetical protein
MSPKKINEVFDVFSLEPATKFEILDLFKENFGLKYKVVEVINIPNATGNKEYYYSINKRSEVLNYIPKHTSLESILIETKAILKVRPEG